LTMVSNVETVAEINGLIYSIFMLRPFLIL